MRLINIYGYPKRKNVSKYLIKWDGESKSIIQFKVKQFFKPFWQAYIVYEEFPVYGSLLKVDILNASLRIAVEVHGPQHSGFHYFHNNSPNAYLESIKRDMSKRKWLETNKFKLIEINFDEIDQISTRFIKEKFDVVL